MRFGDERESSNFEDVTGRSGLGFGGGGLGGGGLGCLIPLIASRFGIGDLLRRSVHPGEVPIGHTGGQEIGRAVGDVDEGRGVPWPRERANAGP